MQQSEEDVINKTLKRSPPDTHLPSLEGVSLIKNKQPAHSRKPPAQGKLPFCTWDITSETH